MRRALTLIELILSMLIIAIVFTVIPRLIHSMNQSSQTAIKEEAMFNAMTLMGAIINLPWDANNTEHDQILHTASANHAYDCNASSGYRIGGFVGGRNCRPLSDGTNLNASIIGKEGTLYNDLDDYRDTNLTADQNCSSGKKGLYALSTSVIYVDDPSSAGNAVFSANPSAGTSNTKRVYVRVGYGSDSQHSGCITALEYNALNIGQMHINSRDWN